MSKKNNLALQIFADRAIKEVQRQWKFECGVVNNIDPTTGKVNILIGGREFSKEGVGNVYDNVINIGDPVLHLGSTVNDMPMGFGRSPWTCG